MLIDGHWLPSSDGHLREVIDPATNVVRQTVTMDQTAAGRYVADFKIDANATASPQFLMSTGGLGAMGEAGVSKALEIIHKELDLTMAFCGRTRVADVDRSILLPGTFPT